MFVMSFTERKNMSNLLNEVKKKIMEGNVELGNYEEEQKYLDDCSRRVTFLVLDEFVKWIHTRPISEWIWPVEMLTNYKNEIVSLNELSNFRVKNQEHN